MESAWNASERSDRPSNDSASARFASELNLPYTVCEILVAICAIFGNGLVIIVFAKERRLRRRTNYYIISLATADLLVGLFAIPFAILASIGLPSNLHACLFTVSVLVVLCTISIFCLVAVSVDRYWAILHPMGYSRTVRTKTAIGIICVCWIAGTLVGFLPLLGWNAGTKSDDKCIFTEVMDYNYLVFLYFATIIFPALLIAAFYAHIYRVVVKQLQQIVTMNPGGRTGTQTTGTMLRLLGAARKREVKATQNLSRIVAFFIVCWFPLYTINCVMAFCPNCEVNTVLMNSCIILSHMNSVGNPLLYAYHLKDFRAALKSFMWRLLFPNSDVKSSMASVIHDRGCLVTSQRQLRGQIGPALAARHGSRLLRQVTDGKARGVISLPASRRCSFGEREERDGLATNSPRSESQAVDATITGHHAGHPANPFVGSSTGSSTGSPAVVSPGPTANHGNESNTSGVAASSIQLRTYAPRVTSASDEPDHPRDSSPTSVFVIEVDVNRVTSACDLRTSDERTGQG